MPTLNDLLHAARWHRHWQVLLLVFAAISACFAFLPSVPPLLGALHDKVSHVAAFAAMGLAAALAGPAHWRHTALAGTVLLAYGGVIELVQSLLPTRHAEGADLLADGVGIAAGLLLAALLRRIWRAQVG